MSRAYKEEHYDCSNFILFNEHFPKEFKQCLSVYLKIYTYYTYWHASTLGDQGIQVHYYGYTNRETSEINEFFEELGCDFVL